MSAIKECGLRISEDIDIVGFDDIPLSADTSPPLTTVRQPMRMQGYLAAKMLLERINGGKNAPRKECVLGCELIIRESSVLLKS